VTKVLLSHLHKDHVSGPAENLPMEAASPHFQPFIMQQRELEYAVEKGSRVMKQNRFLPGKFIQLGETGRQRTY
jgi:ribonuclease BN (tRNA processing enzyme)